jgi:hypothetical protein
MVTNPPDETLLPLNATRLEKELEKSFLWEFGENIRGFKFSETGAEHFFEELLYEYALNFALTGNLDIADIFKEGIQFQRLRGTPAALKMALGWLGLKDVAVEETGPGEHFYEFQLALEELPADLVMDDLVTLIDIAKPLRARLKRIYNPLNDRKILFFDDNNLDDAYLENESGVHADGDLIISIGRLAKYYTEPLQPSIAYGLSRYHTFTVYDDNPFRLSLSWLDGDSLLDAGNMVYMAHDKVNSFESSIPLGYGAHFVIDKHTYGRSQLLLDSDVYLDTEDAVLDGRRLVEMGHALMLDSEDTLDNTPWRSTWIPLDKREIRQLLVEISHPQDYIIGVSHAYTRGYECYLLGDAEMVHKTGFGAASAEYTGPDFWYALKVPERPWNSHDPRVEYALEPEE